jgi:CspA family cold shock protein
MRLPSRVPSSETAIGIQTPATLNVASMASGLFLCGDSMLMRPSVFVELITTIALLVSTSAVYAASDAGSKRNDLAAKPKGPEAQWSNATKGFGFVAPDGGSQDVFVHISAVERAGLNGLNEGQKISYEVVTDPRRGKSSAEKLKAL